VRNEEGEMKTNNENYLGISRFLLERREAEFAAVFRTLSRAIREWRWIVSSLFVLCELVIHELLANRREGIEAAEFNLPMKQIVAYRMRTNQE
jgi:hypothetical protein